jgi:hypothetical protein
MRRILFLSTFVLMASSLPTIATAEPPFASLVGDDWQSQWEGDSTWFRREGDAIVAGRLDQPVPQNMFLCSREEFGDFELELEVKLKGEGDNAGVQFRTAKIADSHEVSGYQADVGNAWDRPVWGALYDESRRNRLLADPGAEVIGKALRADDWNQLRIRCEGPRIQIWLNEALTVDYVEEDKAIPASGVIALQIHSGPPAEAWYRRIRVRSL